MQDKMECDWFKPSKHEVIFSRLFQNIQLQNSQQFIINNPNKTSQQTQQNVTTNIFVFSTLETKMREMHKMKKVSNTGINKLNWRLIMFGGHKPELLLYVGKNTI